VRFASVVNAINHGVSTGYTLSSPTCDEAFKANLVKPSHPPREATLIPPRDPTPHTLHGRPPSFLRGTPRLTPSTGGHPHSSAGPHASLASSHLWQAHTYRFELFLDPLVEECPPALYELPPVATVLILLSWLVSVHAVHPPPHHPWSVMTCTGGTG
jgi:hypothetical protein